MKGKRWLLWILTVCLLAVCCGAMADEWAPKGKTEAVSEYGVDRLNYTIYSRSIYSLDENEGIGNTVMLGGADGAMEQATSVEVTFLSGDEGLKNLFVVDRHSPSTIWVKTPAEGVTGEAAFRIRAESPKFYLEKEVHPEVRVLDTDTINLDAFIYQVEIGKAANVAMMMINDFSSHGLPFITGFNCSLDGLREADTDEYLLTYDSFTARREGDWWMDLVLRLDEAGTSIKVPLILHTGDTLRPETASKLADYRAANGVKAEKKESTETETAADPEGTQEQETAEAEGTREQTAAGGEEASEQAAAGAEATQDAETAGMETASASAAAEEEPPFVKPVAEDPQGENWAQYLSEKILPALEPTLNKETYVMTRLAIHGQESNVTYGTKFNFSRPQDGALLGSMHVHFSGTGSVQEKLNRAVPCLYTYFFPLTNYLRASYQEADLPISAEAIRTYSLGDSYSCTGASYFHQIYEGKDWQVMSVYFDAQKEDGVHYPLDGKHYIFLVIQDLNSVQPFGFLVTENYIIADQDMVRQIEKSVLTWEHMPEVLGMKEKESLDAWFNEIEAAQREDESGAKSLAGEWRCAATFWGDTKTLDFPYMMVMLNLSEDGTGTISFNHEAYESATWEMNNGMVIITYHGGERKWYMARSGNRLYFGTGQDKISRTAYILVGPDDPLYFREYRRGHENETDPYDFSISAKDNPGEVEAGKKLNFKAEFEHSDVVNQKAKNNQVIWNVSLPDGSGAEAYASISDKGVLTVNKELTERVQLDVRAASQGGTTAVYHLTAVPVLKELRIEPNEIVLYLGESKAARVKIVAEPASAMPKDLQWSNNNKGKYLGLGFTTNRKQELNVAARGVGKTVLTVKDPLTGKSSKATVTVLAPVTSIDVTGPETVKAGKTASYKAALEPKKDINKNVIWTVDVAESVATVNEKGQLKVAKDAPAGTVITLTAKAQGTENDITDTLRIVVE